MWGVVIISYRRQAKFRSFPLMTSESEGGKYLDKIIDRKHDLLGDA